MNYTPEQIARLLFIAEKTQEIMCQEGAIEQGWRFEYHDSTRALGLCNYSRKVISLDKTYVLLNSDELVMDTAKHEVAHFCAGYKYGDHGHGRYWKIECVRIGAKPQRCKGEEDGLVSQRKVNWEATCGGCGKRYTWGRKPTRRIHGCWCKQCGPVNGRLTIRES